MFESAELGHKIDKASYRTAIPGLRSALLDAQFEVRENGTFPVVILIAGINESDKSATVNTLYEWMDPRYLSTLAPATPTDEERDRPHMWRYWRALPPKGRIGILSASWYFDPIRARIEEDPLAFDQRIDQINRFEAMLVNEGALVLKFWLHLTPKGQRERHKRLKDNPATAWRAAQEAPYRRKMYNTIQTSAGHVLRLTNTPWAPWMVVEATDDRYRKLTLGKTILDALQKRLADHRDQNFPVAPPLSLRTDQLDVLTALDLGQKLRRPPYKAQLAELQGRLAELVRHPRFQDRSVVVVFEGSDAAGKGGAIRRVAAAMDARQYRIVSIAAPSEEERAQPYLWRFWRHIPRTGQVAIFDRSWYGRVLVERVEGFCSEADWLRAYTEINDFEHELHEAGAVVVKFWLQISPDEQLARFEARAAIPFKRFKITEEDWRNRDKAEAYHHAVCDMVDRTSTGLAPWTLVEANDKNFARVKVLKTLCARLEAVLKSKP